MSEITSSHPSRARRVPPGPSPFSQLPKNPAKDRDFFRVLSSMQREFGDVVRIGLPGMSRTIVIHPDDVQHVLHDNYHNYTKDCFEYSMLRLVLGRGLVTTDGDLWKQQRKLAAPAFTPKRVATFAQGMAAAGARMLESWEDVERTGEPFDLVPHMMDVTLRIVSDALFGFETTDESSRIGPDFGSLMEALMGRNPLSPPLWVPTPGNRRMNRALGVMHGVVDGIIDRRRADRDAGVRRGDLLTSLLDARDDETGEGIDPVVLRDQVLTLMLAGHETTAMALTWTFYELSLHPEVRRRLQDEVDSVLGGRVPQHEDLAALQYTRRVIDESMRLHPPVWAIGRVAREADEVSGYPVRPGQVLFLSPYATHRHPSFWENPEGFDPDRFEPARVRERHRFAYFPFAGGPRVCIGNSFALMEAQILLAQVAQRYEIDLVSGHPVEPQALITMRPREGLLVTLRKR